MVGLKGPVEFALAVAPAPQLLDRLSLAAKPHSSRFADERVAGRLARPARLAGVATLERLGATLAERHPGDALFVKPQVGSFATG